MKITSSYALPSTFQTTSHRPPPLLPLLPSHHTYNTQSSRNIAPENPIIPLSSRNFQAISFSCLFLVFVLLLYSYMHILKKNQRRSHFFCILFFFFHFCLFLAAQKHKSTERCLKRWERRRQRQRLIIYSCIHNGSFKEKMIVNLI